jgi:peroxiredoxin
LAVKLAAGGAWLFLWPLAFWVVRFLAFFIFPAAAIVLIYVRYHKGSTGLLVYVNLVLALALASTVWGIQSFTKSEARAAIAKQFGDLSPAEILNRESGARSLPALSLLGPNGQAADLGEQVRTARVSLVVFFASYDIAWSDNIKAAREIHRTMAKDGVLVLGINEQESQETVKSFIAKQRLDFPIFRDSDGKYLRLIGGLGSVEQMLVVDRNAKVIARRARDSESIERIKDALLAQIKQ